MAKERYDEYGWNTIQNCVSLECVSEHIALVRYGYSGPRKYDEREVFTILDTLLDEIIELKDIVNKQKDGQHDRNKG